MSFSLRYLAVFALTAVLWFPAGAPTARAQSSLSNDPSACLEDAVIDRDTVDLESDVKDWRNTTLQNAEDTGNFHPLLDPDSIRVSVGKGTGDDLWHSTSNGGRVWCLEIKTPTHDGKSLAGAVQLVFENFDLPSHPAAGLTVYDDDGDTNENYDVVLGPYDSGDNAQQGFITDEVDFANGDAYLRRSLIVAYYEPPSTQSAFSIPEVDYDFYHSDQLGASGAWITVDGGPCHLSHLNASRSVGCTVSRPWANEIQAAVQIIQINGGGGRGYGSGVLLNSAQEDLTPYVLTAAHVVGDTTSPAGTDLNARGNKYLFRFNYQSDLCGSGTPLNEPSYDVISDGTLFVKGVGGPNRDFALIRLSGPIPSSYKVYYSGWSIEDVPPTKGTVIGHPRGDIKKIAFSNMITWHDSSPNYFWFARFQQGAIEDNMSGSPFFNEDHYTVGVTYCWCHI